MKKTVDGKELLSGMYGDGYNLCYTGINIAEISLRTKLSRHQTADVHSLYVLTTTAT